jgi:hypothetical protein
MVVLVVDLTSVFVEQVPLGSYPLLDTCSHSGFYSSPNDRPYTSLSARPCPSLDPRLDPRFDCNPRLFLAHPCHAQPDLSDPQRAMYYCRSGQGQG